MGIKYTKNIDFSWSTIYFFKSAWKILFPSRDGIVYPVSFVVICLMVITWFQRSWILQYRHGRMMCSCENVPAIWPTMLWTTNWCWEQVLEQRLEPSNNIILRPTGLVRPKWIEDWPWLIIRVCKHPFYDLSFLGEERISKLWKSKIFFKEVVPFWITVFWSVFIC